jgi:putative YhgA-like transposase
VAKSTRKGKQARPRHDPVYKGIFSQETMVKELLQGFVHGDWIDQLDFSTLERLGNSFVSADLRERHSDLIWRLRLRGDGDGWVYLYLLLEFQSASDPFMAVRLLTYVGLLLEDIIRKEKLKPGDRLPAVLPLVIHSSRSRWRAPLRLETHFAPVPKDLRRYLPRLTYLLLDERRLDLDRPELERNPTAAFFRIEANDIAAAIPDLHLQLQDRLPSGDSALRRAVDAWIMEVVQRAYPEAIIPEGMNLEEAPMGLEETLIRDRDRIQKEARREGGLLSLRTMLLDLMTERFGRLPASVRQQIEETSSIQELRKLGRKVLRAKTLQDMGLGHG